MTTARLEKIGDRVGLILDEETCAALHASIGDVVHLHRTPAGELVLDGPDADYDSRHGRGRAFLKRYQRSLQVFTSS